MVSFIKDSDVAGQLSEKGFVKIDFLNSIELHHFREIFETHRKSIADHFHHGIHMTTWMSSVSLKARIRQDLETLFQQPCERAFRNYRSLNHVFIVKQKHASSAFPLHQDWSSVDEEKFASINVWVAMQDINKRNGGIYFIEGSHRLPNKVRGAGLLSFDFNLCAQELKSEVTHVKIKAGQALLFFHSTVHGSLPNQQREPRVIAANSVIGKETEMQINYFDATTGSVRQYAVSDNFSYEYDDIRNESLNRPPGGKLINEKNDFILPKFKVEDILKYKTRRSWLQKLTGR